MSRKGVKERLAEAAESKTGTYGEMMDRATKEPAASRASASWATPRPEPKSRQSRADKGTSNVTTLVPVPSAGEELERLLDEVTVESLYDVIDLILPKLHPKDQSIFLQLFRRTHAIGRKKCVISFAELARLGNVGLSGATYSVQRLEHSTPRMVLRTGKRLGKGKSQGVEIEVFLPTKF